MTGLWKVGDLSTGGMLAGVVSAGSRAQSAPVPNEVPVEAIEVLVERKRGRG